MIHSIGSTLPSFKALTFHAGLNVLLAERHKASSETDTRNGAGKSSVVDIVHFLLGASLKGKSIFKNAPLLDHEFDGVFSFDGHRFEVARGGRDPDRVFVRSDHPSRRRVGLALDMLSGREFVSLDEWKRWLGHLVFKLPLQPGERKAFDEKHAPSFRQLFGYFARRRVDGGFHEPTKFFNQQSACDVQVALSYLLGLDWELAREFELERQDSREHSAGKRRAAARATGGLSSVASLRALLAVEQAAAEKKGRDVENFKVEEHFDDLAREAAAAKVRLDELSVELAVAESAIRHLEATVAEEEIKERPDIERMYSVAGIALPTSVTETFDNVRSFHASVVANRRLHLDEEISFQNARAGEIRKEMRFQGARRSEILTSLDGKGAFRDLIQQQRTLTKLEEKVARTESLLKDAEDIDEKDSTLKIDREKLRARLSADQAARVEQIKAAAIAFSEAKTALYGERRGALEIRATPSGPKFDVWIEQDLSGGISNMELFCFDYALFKISSGLLGGPGFLLHDSHLFADVDARQIASAIDIATAAVGEVGAQYIVHLNSDEFGKLSLPSHVDIAKARLPVTLDDTETGGLFGVRFG